MNVRKELFDNADPEYREFHTKIVAGSREIIGVRMPVLRKMSKRICNGDWRQFLDRPAEYHEECMLKALVTANVKVSFEERLELTKKFMPEIDNWALCDIFCGEWVVKEADKERLWDYCMELIKTDDEFMMRVSAVMMLDHFLDDDHIDMVLELLTTKYNPGYYYKMGAAWTLSYCYIKYPDRTEPMLFGGPLDSDIRNMAIRKITDSFRVSKEDKARLKAKKKSLD
ncbi:DNA alkylation repair enzyme [Candidatus Methanoplasma termitum]|uniref:DNA alkylation repair enzyme n=1 Tax=Candidatus Methanoplasma termitum TaxID=1577791 RepID=A0A0A7LDB1_9ARCH|nr:DNA alkylation repair protein [Candidatus Methanoplasma termitum]AIZ56302.1 DNA alkylation repair enzyme [Candidatus Methanoplasma termitum]